MNDLCDAIGGSPRLYAAFRSRRHSISKRSGATPGPSSLRSGTMLKGWPLAPASKTSCLQGSKACRQPARHRQAV